MSQSVRLSLLQQERSNTHASPMAPKAKSTALADIHMVASHSHDSPSFRAPHIQLNPTTSKQPPSVVTSSPASTTSSRRTRGFRSPSSSTTLLRQSSSSSSYPTISRVFEIRSSGKSLRTTSPRLESSSSASSRNSRSAASASATPNTTSPWPRSSATTLD